MRSPESPYLLGPLGQDARSLGVGSPELSSYTWGQGGKAGGWASSLSHPCYYCRLGCEPAVWAPPSIGQSSKSPPTLPLEKTTRLGLDYPWPQTSRQSQGKRKGREEWGLGNTSGSSLGGKSWRNCRAGKWRGFESITRKEGESEADRGRACVQRE